jgi:hypothetical protein
MAENKLFNNYLSNYLANLKKSSKRNNDELEIRFGTNFRNPITRIDFENVIQKIKSSGWTLINSDSNYTLKIQNEYITSDGTKRLSNVRTEISGIKNIQNYCKTDNINKINQTSVNYLQKRNKKNEKDEKLDPIDFNNFQFRINYKEEISLNKKWDQVKSLVEYWTENKKTFRLIKRFSYKNNTLPFRIDCSVVKSSKKNRNYLIPEYKIENSNVFKNTETYEIEIELLNDRNHFYTNKQPQLMALIKNTIKLVLSGLQETNFPISYNECDMALKQYYSLVHIGEKYDNKKITPRDFIGPSSISLEMSNIILSGQTSSEPNINNSYTVTDKADGQRKLLFINKTGSIYLIDVNMKIQFTGCKVAHKNYVNTIIDGEHVLQDKTGKYINSYLCFDIYTINGKDVRAFPFIKGENLVYENKDLDKNIFRYDELTKFISNIQLSSVVKNKPPPMDISVKKFYDNVNGSTIYEQCKKILDKEVDGLVDYETDGLIFTPAFYGVGSDKIGVSGPKNKITWRHSFKWKPSEFNTIDFLIRTVKDKETNKDIIKNELNDGTDLSSTQQYKSYKTIELRVGYDENKHGFINPLEDLIQHNLPKKKWSNYNENDYKAALFHPTDPTPSYPIYLTNIYLHEDKHMKTMLIEDKTQSFDDYTIVEFKFNKENRQGWQWIPIRVRHDKTAELHSKKRKNYGNAYHVAQSVWRSINNPITKEMITTGIGLPEEIIDASVYYKKKHKDTTTQGLRDFHNKYVKNNLIKYVCKRGDTLIDHTVGKAGDLQKWINKELSFVFGIDNSKDNIINRTDGACARYLSSCKKNKNMPDALFIHADSSKNLKNGEATKNTNVQSQEIINAVFSSEKPKTNLKKGVLKVYGKGADGFDIVSNQFSIHYFFESKKTVHNFIRNISESCKVGGYFIGTTYDGKEVFKKLKNTSYNENISIVHKEEKMWEIKKLYNETEFANNETSIGYKIDVFQESINNYIPEYLVNFDYFIILMQEYGFIPITTEEANQMNFPHAIGTFKELYNQMIKEIRENKIKKKSVGKASEMTEYEKEISFLNNYFIFKKISNPDAKSIALRHIDNVVIDYDDMEIDETIVKEKKIKITKLTKRIKLPK